MSNFIKYYKWVFHFQESDRFKCSEVEFTLEGKKIVKDENEEPQCIELSNSLTQRTDRDLEQDGVLSVRGSDETQSNSTEQSSAVKDTETDFTENGQINACSDNSRINSSPQSDLEHFGNKTPGLNSDQSDCGESNCVDKMNSVDSKGVEISAEGVTSVEGGGHSCDFNQTAGDMTVNSGVSINGMKEDQILKKDCLEEKTNNLSCVDSSMMENEGENSGCAKCEENNFIKDTNGSCDIENGYLLSKGKSESHEEIRVLDHNYVGDSDCTKFNCEVTSKTAKTNDTPKSKKSTKSRKSKSRKKREDKVVKEKKPVRTKSTTSKFVELVPEDKYQSKNIFDHSEAVVPKNFFECICGVSDEARGTSNSRKKKHRVQCVMCGLYQHAECVGYNLEDPYRGQFKCPHCHVLSVSNIPVELHIVQIKILVFQIAFPNLSTIVHICNITVVINLK